MKIQKNSIPADSSKIIKLNVARLPTGTPIHIQAHVFRSSREGPTVLVLGGVHGDEINGIEIVRRAIAQKIFHDLQRGSVIAIPMLNIYGFLHFSRETPDGKDVNRSFPGSLNGSLSSRVARNLTKHILPLVDFGIDFHTGGAQRYNYPQIRYTRKDERAAKLAAQFAPPLILPKATFSKTLRREAFKKDIPILVFEGGEALRLDGFVIDNAIQGLKRILHAHQMIASAPEAHHLTRSYDGMTWVRAKRSGIFEWTQQSGTHVEKGELLGYIRDPYGQYEKPIPSTRTGFIIGHNNAPVISQGDALFHIAYNKA